MGLLLIRLSYLRQLTKSAIHECHEEMVGIILNIWPETEIKMLLKMIKIKEF